MSKRTIGLFLLSMFLSVMTSLSTVGFIESMTDVVVPNELIIRVEFFAFILHLIVLISVYSDYREKRCMKR